MKKIILTLITALATLYVQAQPANYVPYRSRIRHIAFYPDSTSHIVSGATVSIRSGYTGPGALFYRTTDSTVYTWTGTQWIKIRGIAPTNVWFDNGNTGTTPGTYFIGTTDAVDFVTKTNNTEKMRVSTWGGVGINTSTITAKLHIKTDAIGATQTDSTGIFLENSTAATSGVTRQFSPALVWRGQAWQNSITTSTTHLWRAYVAPTNSGFSFKNSVWHLQTSQGGDAYYSALTLQSGASGTILKIFKNDGFTYGSVNAVPIGADGIGNVWLGSQPNTSATGANNLFIGSGAFAGIYTGTGDNTAIGHSALAANTSGANNTAVGWQSLMSNLGGSTNTAVGLNAMMTNTSGSINAAFGTNALLLNTTGEKNSVFGAGGMENNTTGSFNTGIGQDNGLNNTTGIRNVWVGWNAKSGTDGYQNIMMGYLAGASLTAGNHDNIFIGGLQTGNNASQKVDVRHSIALGTGAYTTANNQLTIGDSLTRFTFPGVSRGVANYVLTDSLGNGQYWVARPGGGGGGGTVIPSIYDFRITTETGVPVPTGDNTGEGTIYMTPYIGNHISLYNGADWVDYTAAEVSLALTVTSGKNYDVFVWDDDGTITLELSDAWTNDNTRDDALTRQDGVWVKSGATNKRWIGTIRASGTNTTEDSEGGSTTQVGGKRFVWNAYNQVRRTSKVVDKTDSWSYTTATWRQENGAAGNQVEYVTGDASVLVDAEYDALMYSLNTSAEMFIGIGISSTTAPSGFAPQFYSFAGSVGQAIARYRGTPGLGYFYVSALEKGSTGGTSNFRGDAAADAQSGLSIIINN